MSAHSPPYALPIRATPWSHLTRQMAERHGLDESLMAHLAHEAMVVASLYRNRGLAGVFWVTLCRLVDIAKKYGKDSDDHHNSTS